MTKAERQKLRDVLVQTYPDATPTQHEKGADRLCKLIDERESGNRATGAQVQNGLLAAYHDLLRDKVN